MIEEIINQIDLINQEDPNLELEDRVEHPKELLYARRMTQMLALYDSNPSLEMQVAVHGQHIKRWSIPRSSYPMDRKGYLKWRTDLKLFHAKLLSEIMEEVRATAEGIEKVKDLVTKKRLKTDPETQQLEDVVCLVFLKYYFSAFAKEHDHDKIISIVQKTWKKMTEKGHEMALKLPYADSDLKLIQKALK